MLHTSVLLLLLHLSSVLDNLLDKFGFREVLLHQRLLQIGVVLLRRSFNAYSAHSRQLQGLPLRRLSSLDRHERLLNRDLPLSKPLLLINQTSGLRQRLRLAVVRLWLEGLIELGRASRVRRLISDRHPVVIRRKTVFLLSVRVVEAHIRTRAQVRLGL